jgi:cytochrome c peroxidase
MFLRAAFRRLPGRMGPQLTRSFAKTAPRVGMAAVTAGVGVTAFSSVAFAAEKDVDVKAVRSTIADMLDQPDYDDGSLGPLLVRLAWHSSGTYSKNTKTGGSGGATMRFSPEADHGANAGLNIARDVLEPVKQKYPGISYADLYTLAGAVAIEEMGGPTIPWRVGRSDDPNGSTCTPDGRLPDAAQGAQHLRDIFYRMGFNDQEIVALAGAHAIGRCHTDRSGFKGPWTRAPTTFSNMYFTELLDNTWTKKNWSGPEQFADPTGELMMLPSDLAIRDDPKFRVHAERYAKDEAAFFKDFSSAFGKLMELGVDFPKESVAPKLFIASLIALGIQGGQSLPFPFPGGK